MSDWIAKLDDFLKLSDQEILTHAGKVSHETARLKAEKEFEKYQTIQAPLPQPVDRDFEQAMDEVKKIEDEAKKESGRKKKEDGK